MFRYKKCPLIPWLERLTFSWVLAFQCCFFSQLGGHLMVLAVTYFSLLGSGGSRWLIVLGRLSLSSTTTTFPIPFLHFKCLLLLLSIPIDTIAILFLLSFTYIHLLPLIIIIPIHHLTPAMQMKVNVVLNHSQPVIMLVQVQDMSNVALPTNANWWGSISITGWRGKRLEHQEISSERCEKRVKERICSIRTRCLLRAFRNGEGAATNRGNGTFLVGTGSCTAGTGATASLKVISDCSNARIFPAACGEKDRTGGTWGTGSGTGFGPESSAGIGVPLAELSGKLRDIALWGCSRRDKGSGDKLWVDMLAELGSCLTKQPEQSRGGRERPTDGNCKMVP